jgi:hypothetical protein
MRNPKMDFVWAGALLLALTLALPAGAPGVAAAGLVGGGWGTVLGCMACAGAGVAAMMSGGWLAAVLWSKVAFSASLACIGVCATALT